MERWNLGRDKGALRQGNRGETRNKGIEQVLGPRGTPNQDKHIRYKSPHTRYDRSAATLPNNKTADNGTVRLDPRTYPRSLDHITKEQS